VTTPEIAVVEIDLEWQLGEVGSGEIKSGLRQVDTVIVADLGSGQCGLHRTGIAAGNVEEAEGRRENTVQGFPEDTAHLAVGQAIAFDELAVRGPLLLELRKRGGVHHCAAGLELMDMNVYQVRCLTSRTGLQPASPGRSGIERSDWLHVAFLARLSAHCHSRVSYHSRRQAGICRTGCCDQDATCIWAHCRNGHRMGVPAQAAQEPGHLLVHHRVLMLTGIGCALVSNLAPIDPVLQHQIQGAAGEMLAPASPLSAPSRRLRQLPGAHRKTYVRGEFFSR
jgi:hypothetical protein